MYKLAEFEGAFGRQRHKGFARRALKARVFKRLTPAIDNVAHAELSERHRSGRSFKDSATQAVEAVARRVASPPLPPTAFDRRRPTTVSLFALSCVRPNTPCYRARNYRSLTDL